LVTPKVLRCLADTRPAASGWVAFSNSSLSYFVGVNADLSKPNTILAGDRNITNDWVGPLSVMRLGPNDTLRWTAELHQFKGNVLFEYRIPQIQGLVATFDYQFSGTRPANDTNSFFAAGYNLFDVGVRYTAKIGPAPVTWRLAVDNVTDHNYWSTVAPSNLTGATN